MQQLIASLIISLVLSLLSGCSGVSQTGTSASGRDMQQDFNNIREANDVSNFEGISLTAKDYNRDGSQSYESYFYYSTDLY